MADTETDDLAVLPAALDTFVDTSIVLGEVQDLLVAAIVVVRWRHQATVLLVQVVAAGPVAEDIGLDSVLRLAGNTATGPAMYCSAEENEDLVSDKQLKS